MLAEWMGPTWAAFGHVITDHRFPADLCSGEL